MAPKVVVNGGAQDSDLRGRKGDQAVQQINKNTSFRDTVDVNQAT